MRKSACGFLPWPGGPVFALEALVAGPGLDQGAVHREVLGGKQLAGPGLRQHLLEEGLGDLAFQQAIAVLGEHGHVPHRIVDVQIHEPTEEQVVLELLHQLPLGANRVKRLQQQRPQQPFRGNGVPPRRRVEFGKQWVHRPERPVDHGADRPQRVIGGNPLLQRNIAEHRRLLSIRAAHGSSSLKSCFGGVESIIPDSVRISATC